VESETLPIDPTQTAQNDVDGEVGEVVDNTVRQTALARRAPEHFHQGVRVRLHVIVQMRLVVPGQIILEEDLREEAVNDHPHRIGRNWEPDEIDKGSGLANVIAPELVAIVNVDGVFVATHVEHVRPRITDPLVREHGVPA